MVVYIDLTTGQRIQHRYVLHACSGGVQVRVSTASLSSVDSVLFYISIRKMGMLSNAFHSQTINLSRVKVRFAAVNLQFPISVDLTLRRPAAFHSRQRCRHRDNIE